MGNPSPSMERSGIGYKALIPIGPDVRTIANGGLLAVADDGSGEKLWVFQQLSS